MADAQPKFIQPAVAHLPFLPRYAISMSPSDARAYFWPAVHGFSMYFSALGTPAGQAFLAECKAAGKAVCSWTVNGEEQMRECARWGVDSVISDKPGLWRKVKGQVRLCSFRRPPLPCTALHLAVSSMTFFLLSSFAPSCSPHLALSVAADSPRSWPTESAPSSRP